MGKVVTLAVAILMAFVSGMQFGTGDNAYGVVFALVAALWAGNCALDWRAEFLKGKLAALEDIKRAREPSP